MLQFNTQLPTSLDAIEQYIGGYATPEAAEKDTWDNARGGYNYLTKSYQTMTGDAFADPFKDASDARTKAVANAAFNGASVATGSNMGMKLLTLPTVNPAAPAPNVNGQPSAPVPLLPALSAVAQHQQTSALMSSMLQRQGRDYQLAGKDMQIPDVIDDNFYTTLQKRANLLGVSREFSKIPASVLTTSSNEDSRFDKTQAGKAIGTDIHPIAYDDNFQELARREPEKANALYHAVTNRDYDTDVKAKSQLLVEQRTDRRKIIEGIKGLEADPVTGDLYKVVERTDPLGQVQRQRVQITPLEKAAIDAEGGTKRLYGVDLPGRGGLPKLPGMSDTELVQYRDLTQKFMKEKGLNVSAASQLAHKTLYQEQQERLNPTAQKPGSQQWSEAISDSLISGGNVPIQLLNQLLAGTGHDLGTNSSEPIPQIPHPNWDEVKKNYIPPADVLREILNYARGFPAGRTYDNIPIMPAPPLAVIRRR